MTQSPLARLATHERARREILLRCDRLPPLPEVVVEVIQLLEAPDTEPEDLARHLQRDPALVARMLGTVNSPLYGLNRTISSIVEAVVVLGFRGLRSLVLASGTSKYLQSDFQCYGHDRAGLWRHSLAVAAGCRGLAASLPAADREELFVAGLLHDIGKLVLAPYLRENELQLDLGSPLTEAEQRTLGIDHTEAGALVAARWNLSPRVQDILRHHHAESPPAALRQAIAAVRVADALAKRAGIGLTQPALHTELDGEDLDHLCTDRDAWSQREPQLLEAMRATADQIAVDVPR